MCYNTDRGIKKLPTVFVEGPYRFYFFSREETRRHVHVASSDGEVKIWLEPKVTVAKVINLSTNVAALVVFIMNGQVLFTIGIAAAASNMLGNYIGTGLVMTKGSKIVKPIVIIVLLLLLVKIITGY